MGRFLRMRHSDEQDRDTALSMDSATGPAPRGQTARRSVPTSEVIGLHSADRGTTVYPWMRGKIPRLKTGKTAGGRGDFQPRCLIEEQAPRLPLQKAELQQPGYVWMLLVLAIES